jgi:hypothetical protein
LSSTQQIAPYVTREEVNAFADVFAAFEMRHYGTSNPKPAPPPIRRSLFHTHLADVSIDVSVAMRM